MLQGGTRSGKTYSVLSFLIRLCYQHQNAGMIISICRKTLPALKGSAMRDFIEILSGMGVYTKNNHNKSDNEYRLFGNTVEFLNLDDEQKVRGRKRHICFINEANEIDLHTFRQLAYRTTSIIIVDYNPSIIPEHWLISELLTRENTERIITTYKDNPHLTEEQIYEIERLEQVDKDAWKVFGLGELGDALRGLVFPNWEIGWEEGKGTVHAFGLDFGYSPDPCVLVEAKIMNGKLYARECFHKNYLTPDMIIEEVKKYVSGSAEVFCDHRPELIQALFKKGVNAKKAVNKDIDAGIKMLKQFPLTIHEGSKNLQKELRNYKHLDDKNGVAIPGKYIDNYNHLLDALRYVVSSKYSIGKGTMHRGGVKNRSKR
jgi:phage terminase large subunit